MLKREDMIFLMSCSPYNDNPSNYRAPKLESIQPPYSKYILAIHKDCEITSLRT